jgi:HSP20 family protein
MTIYVTPFARSARRQMVERMLRHAEYPEMMESDVYFPVDVRAENDAFVLTALLPGVSPDEVNVQIVNETVSIQGEYKHERKESDQYLLQELPNGRFSRVLTLPAQLDSTKAEANMENGVLSLRIPKAETARPKTIKVSKN